VVIGPPDVAQAVEAAGQLLAMVGDVRQQVGRQPIRLDHHPVFLVPPQHRGAQPDRVVSPLDEARPVEHLEGGLYLAGLVQLALALPDVEVHLEACQRPPDHLETARDREALDGLDVRWRRRRHPAAPVAREQLPPDAPDVVAPVAVLGEDDLGHRGIRGTRGLHVAGPHRQGQHRDLVARVVQVELPDDVVTGEAQEAGQRISDGRVTAVREVERPGRVGRQVLDAELGRGLGRAPAPVLARLVDLEQAALPEIVGEAQVDEAGAGHRGLGEIRAGDRAQVLGERLAERTRWLARGLGEAQGHVGRVVAVLGTLRPLERYLARNLRANPLRPRGLRSSKEKIANHGADAVAHLPTM